MTTITDNFGVWNDLGTVTPTRNNWIKFPNDAVGGLDEIRFTFLYDENLFSRLSSYGLIRWKYISGSDELTSKPSRFYVTAEPTIMTLPISPELKNRDIYFRSFEIKKIGRWSTRYIVNDLTWQLKLEELWG